MSKNLLNYHRYKRKWGKRIDQVRHDLTSADEADSSLRDFAWKRRKKNPYHEEFRPAPWRFRAAVIVICACFLGAGGLFLFHPFFFIKHVSVSGVDRLNAAEVQKAVMGTMHYKKLFFIPAQSFFMVNVDEVRDIIKSRFPVAAVEVRKTFPNNITIAVEEKISTIIYDNGKQYSYIGLDGKIVEIVRAVGSDEWDHQTRMVTTTSAEGVVQAKEEVVSSRHAVRPQVIKKEMGDYPIVYDTRQKDGGVNDAALEPETVQGIVTWYQYVSSYAHVPFGYVVIDNELGDAVIYTEEGWELRVRLREDIDKQFEACKLVLDKQASRKGLKYIDIRYPGRVYWQ